MERNRSLRNTTELGLFLLAVTITLVACGGGGGGGTPNSTTTPPVTTAVSTNQVEIALTNGIYHLWGFGLIVSGVPQVYISKTEQPSVYNWSVTKILGAVSSTDNAPRLDDAITNYTTNYWWSFPASSAQATLTIPLASNPSWTFTLNQQDISGQTVISQIKMNNGVLLSPTLANASAVFPAGSIAYTATYVAVTPTVAPGWVLRYGSFGLQPVTTEANMYGAGWCMTVSGQTNQLGVLINASNTISIYSVSTPTCTFTGLTPIGTGSWNKQTSANGDIVYRITYPAIVTTNPAWAPAFTNGYSPAANKTPDLIINAASATSFTTAFDVPVGSTYTTLQPFFNSVALPALRSAAGI